MYGKFTFITPYSGLFSIAVCVQKNLISTYWTCNSTNNLLYYFGLIGKVCTDMTKNNLYQVAKYQNKSCVFWEGFKILRNVPLRNVKTKREISSTFCCLLTKFPLYLLYWNDVFNQVCIKGKSCHKKKEENVIYGYSPINVMTPVFVFTPV